MEQYKNLNGDSGVTAFEIGQDFIRVQFKGWSQYLYSYAAPGRDDVEAMKALARAGRGLGTYISRHVDKRYERKER